MNWFKLFTISEAEEDAKEAKEFYDAKEDGLGDRFVDDLNKMTTLLKQNPEMFAKFEDDVRRGHLKIFPYSFYYQPDMSEELINILAVFAQAKDPKSIRKTLAQRIKALKKSKS